ncbi:MAG: hypothetical protein Q7S22_02105 [Candidatus Micrarchaeota archaeon]|nr:hypothetical protein [Candidatus Micrarchaeota archaeon]
MANETISSVGKDSISSFNLIYANLPMNERFQTVVVIVDQPISWEMAYREINNKTALGNKISEALIKLKIL